VGRMQIPFSLLHPFPISHYCSNPVSAIPYRAPTFLSPCNPVKRDGKLYISSSHCPAKNWRPLTKVGGGQTHFVATSPKLEGKRPTGPTYTKRPYNINSCDCLYILCNVCVIWEKKRLHRNLSLYCLHGNCNWKII